MRWTHGLGLLLPAVALLAAVRSMPGAHAVRSVPRDREIVHYVAPVHGPVVDPFRPPGHIGAAGNRGLEYGNPLGAPVTAAADGWVAWAGRVFGSGTVVIEHADGVRTTYNGLSELWVEAGVEVRQGHGIGLAGTNVHLGALVRSVYLDPQILIDASDATGPARLVPLDDS